MERVLREMRVPAQQLVAIGAEPSDDAFLRISGLPAATADASWVVKQRARVVTHGNGGDGVVELIEELLRDDLRQFVSKVPKMSWKSVFLRVPEILT